MTRPYRVLALAVLAGAALLATQARPRERAAAPTTAAPRAGRPLSVAIAGGFIVPARTAVPKGSMVKLTVVNRDAAPRRLALLGYEDRVTPVLVAPGRPVVIRFAADRPGGDFAWLVDGRPAGSFAVTGSHLVEGHR